MYLMKKNHIAKGLGIAALSLALASCTSGFEEANRPGGSQSKEVLQRDNYNISSFLVQLQNVAFPEQENAYQCNFDLVGNYLGRYFTYANNGWSSKNFATFSAPSGWLGWSNSQILVPAKSAFAEIASLAGKEDLNYNWALIMRAHAFLALTDKYGPMPFGLDATNLEGYNSQEAIYKALVADLDAAASNINAFVLANPGRTVNEAADKIYSGDFSKWVKLAHSLKLRIAIRMRYAAPALAQQYATEAVQAGVIESSADNCAITYIPRGLYKTSVEWGDSRACADIDSYMNGYEDPRIPAYFAAPAKAGDRKLIGCLAGADVKNKNTADEIYSAAAVTKNSPSVWLSAAEMWFCRAEGALAGWSGMGGTAKDLYERGVKESFTQWNVSGADAYLQSSKPPADYKDAVGGYGKDMSATSIITPKWDDSASDEVKLERLIVQKWIALFPNGQEGWSEIRRTGYPKVFALPVSTNGYTIHVANRIPYDVNERTRNQANYNAALVTLGGADDYATKLWWQKK